MTNMIQTSQFTNRTHQIVGRENELKFLNACLNDSSCSHFVYYYGQGGIGKTRMLEEVLQIIDSSKKHFPSSRILDLYHTETHDPNDIEHTIVTRLNHNGKYFKEYLTTWDHYQTLEQRGGSPDQIQQDREQLTARFVQGANQLAENVDKIVLLFDTMEQIQLDSSIVEEKIGMPKIDPRIRGWMLNVLPQIKNVLVVFAGRPKERQIGETKDPQQRLVEDMEKAFAGRFHGKELAPLDLDESRELIKRISMGSQVIDPGDIPIIHKITGGRPILLHLIFDLFNGLSEQPERERELLRQYAQKIGELAGSDLEKATQDFEKEITACIYENTGMMGEYLSRMALMPKGVDQDILINILGLPEVESCQFLEKACKLSFVKTYASSNGDKTLRIFLHDEMYRLINSTLKPHYLRSNERAIARNLIDRYYEPRINELKQKELEVNAQLKTLSSRARKDDDALELQMEVEGISDWRREQNATDLSPADTLLEKDLERELQRELQRLAEEAYQLSNQLHKLQIDKFYYQLAQDPSEGYKLYKRMSYQSAMERGYGYDLPLLDEFLRFYNSEDHRAWFKAVGISPEQVVRESALLWVERLHWCANYPMETEFARAIKANPKELFIDPNLHLGLLANITALADRAEVMLSGYNEAKVKEEIELLARFRETKPQTEEDMLALVRLCTTIGYAYRCGGQYAEAIGVNRIGLEAMRNLKKLLVGMNKGQNFSLDNHPYLGEDIILKNNMAFALAKQGQFTEANITIRAAYRLSQGKPNLRYSQGLTLTIMASIERLQGMHHEALIHGNEARIIFQDLGDHHGQVRSHLNIGSALRQIAEKELSRGILTAALRHQETARYQVEKALKIAEDGKLNDQVIGMQAELGKIHRGIGKILLAGNQPREKYMPELQKGVDYFRKTLNSSRWIEAERADIREDLAELLYVMGNHPAALEEAINVEKDVKHAAHIKPGEVIPPWVSGWISLPLGKAEGLRFKIAMDNENYQAAIEHFIFSYVYYYRYSERAHQIQHLIETLFDSYLSRMNYERRSWWLKEMQNLLAQYDNFVGGVSVQGLLELLTLIDI